MLKNPSVTTRVRLAVAFPAVALALVVFALFPIVQSLRIGGPVYDGVRQLQKLQVDGTPSPLVLSDATSVANQLYLVQFGGTDPANAAAAKDSLLASYKETKTTFADKRLIWTTAIAKDSNLSPLITQVITSGSAVLTEIDTNLVPNLTPATATQARTSIVTVNQLSSVHGRSIDSLSAAVNSEVKAREDAAKSTAWQRLIGLLGLAFLALAGAIIGSRGVMSSLLKPVEALTEQANRAAHHEIPALVAAVNTMEPGTELMKATPFPVVGNDEFSQLAKALNVMQDTAITMAVDQAKNRRGVSESLINLGRRNQGLLARTLTFIAELEQNERNPETLTHLFRLDHLTTRMRRNAESLLVLAGSEPPRVWTESVAISDIIRASLSEIESYGRVDLGGLDPARVKGTAVSDLAHLLAELMENATNFSPPSSRVVVIGTNVAEGYLLSIRDSGIGMTQQEIDDANRRLSDNATTDVTSKVLGHYVVSRLAARHHIRVGLSQTIGSSGVTAEVLLPRTVAETGGAVAPTFGQSQPSPTAMPVSSPMQQSFGHQPATYDQQAVGYQQPMVPQQPVVFQDQPAPVRPEQPVAYQPATQKTPVEPQRTAEGLRKRVRGAQVPNRDVVPNAEQVAFDAREAELRNQTVRGQAQARGHAAPAYVAPAPDAPAYVAPAPVAVAPVAPTPVAPAYVTPVAPAPVATDPAPLAPLPIRSRGQNWIEEPATVPVGEDYRNPTEVRSALAGFQSAPVVVELSVIAPAGWITAPPAAPVPPATPTATPVSAAPMVDASARPEGERRGLVRRQKGTAWVEPDMAPVSFEAPSDPSFVRSSLSAFQNTLSMPPEPFIPTDHPKES